MVANQAFHRALENGTYLNAHFLCGLGKYLLIMECYGADEMYLAMLIIVLHDVPFQESLETVQHQRAHTRLIQILSEEWRQACQEAVREWFAVYTVDDVCRFQIELFEELLFQFRSHLILQNITYQQFAQASTATFVAKDETQGGDVGTNMFAVVITRVGTCAHDAGYARFVSAKSAGGGKHVRIYFYFVARNLEMLDNGTVYHGNFVGEATAGTIKVHSVEGMGR